MSDLNARQRAAIQHVDSPLLVLAGAGSGKTRVITEKIAYLVRERQISAEHIAAVTFTNKAAREMKQRIGRLLRGPAAQGLRVSTFHTLGLNILRSEYKKLGYRRGFTIFDSQDSATLVRELVRKELGGKSDQEDALRWQISRWKNAFLTPEQALAQATDAQQTHAAVLFERYNHYLKTYNAADFDDLIVQPALLFERDADCLGGWRERIRYLLIDEYQDTNACQYRLVQLLVGERRGLTVVGDDDQSIYAWRGAQPENLARLAQDFAGLKVIKLEQNYRSLGRILRSANHLIAHNPHQFEKRLWSELGMGDPLRVLTCKDGDHEAERVVSQLLAQRFRQSGQYRDYAILYRGNHQARVFERVLREHSVPYHLSGGQSFFDRSEVKDVMAYLRLLVNPDDDAAFLRVANTPRRGVGPGTMEQLSDLAASRRLSLLRASQENDLAAQLNARGANSLRQFAQWMEQLSERAAHGDPMVAVNNLIDELGYDAWLKEQSADLPAAQRRMENVRELLAWLGRLARQGNADTALADLLAQMALMDMLERDDENTGNAVSLMTLHAAKGLEFEHVFLVGMEEELLPHRNSIEDGLEEERRLAYVGITRARKSLTFSFARRRKRYGEMIVCEPSRFLQELPSDDLVWEDDGSVDPEQRKERGKAHLAQLRGLLAK